MQNEYIIHEDEIEKIRLLEYGFDSYSIKQESNEKKRTITFNLEQLKTLQGILNQIIPLPPPVEQITPTTAPALNEPVRTIKEGNGVISMSEVAKYLQFNSVQELIDGLPEQIKITPIGTDKGKALVRVAELTKNNVSIDISQLKSNME